MSSSLRAFMAGLIDYAGLFPPAILDMEPAIGNYARYLGDDDAWMLGRFICPASRLPELSPLASKHLKGSDQLRLAVLGRPAENIKSFSRCLASDISDMQGFRSSFGEHCKFEVYETRLPAGLLDSGNTGETQELLESMHRDFMEGLHYPPALFVESPRRENWRQDWRQVIKEIKNYRDQEIALTGFKLRCGGVEAHMYPTVEQVAAAVTMCEEFDVPLKATAGLHHPLRHFNNSAGVMMHGFFNVFGAALLSTVHHLPESIIASIIAEEDPQAFYFNENGFGWREWEIAAPDIKLGRTEAATSFGSCSFDEPREDLQALGLF